MIDENKLPQGWSSIFLEETVVYVLGGDWGQEFSGNQLENYVKVKVIRGTEFKHWKRDKGKSATVRLLKQSSFNKRQLNIGDIIVEISGGGPNQPVGRTIIIDKDTLNKAECPLVCSNFFRQIRINPFLDPEFINYYLTFAYNTGEFIKYQTQTTNLCNLNFNEFISHVIIPIPPLNEQRRIVSKLEKLLSKVESCKDRLEKIPIILKRFRKSVLASACSGRITADWREKNPDVEPAKKLLNKIKHDKKHLYDMLCKKAKLENNKKPSVFKENTEAINSDELLDIPDTWTWDRLVNISHIQGGVTKGRHFGNKKTIMLPYLRVANVQDGFGDLSEIKEIEVLPEDKEKYKLKNGDILFTEGGDRDKLGRGTIWRDNIQNCIHQNHIFRARVYSDSLSPDYISLATKSDYARTYFFENASQTVNLASINMTTIGNVPIAIPPEEEQYEIVRRVESLFKLADSIEARYERAKNYIEKLSQSILSKAFRGELVPRDPSDEPASVLLERIRKDRAGQKKKTNKKTCPKIEKTFKDADNNRK